MEDNNYVVVGIICIIFIVSVIFFYGGKSIKSSLDNVFDNPYSGEEQIKEIGQVKENVLVPVRDKPRISITAPDTTPVLQFVSSTEYSIEDGNGATIIKLNDYKGDKINTTCWETILYPDKSVYIGWTEMTPQLEFSNYYFNFPVPQVIGVYDQEVRCLISNKNISLGKGFHVSNLTGVIDKRIDTLKPDIMMVMN